MTANGTLTSDEDMFQAWSDSEREVWNAWSRLDRDLSQPESTDAIGHLIDGCAASARQMTVLQATTLRCMRATLVANPLLPEPSRAAIDQAFGPLLGWSNWQQQLVGAWFDLARQLTDRH